MVYPSISGVGQWRRIHGQDSARVARPGRGENALYRAGSPWENGYNESFNSKLRDELLNGEIFTTLREAQVLIEQWRRCSAALIAWLASAGVEHWLMNAGFFSIRRAVVKHFPDYR
jgi:hypothetical protein